MELASGAGAASAAGAASGIATGFLPVGVLPVDFLGGVGAFDRVTMGFSQRFSLEVAF
ncbi:MAG: hypothetical protein ORN28_08685 [Rhodoferax sp.]|nr:hypothetical protein [Rhodoferax sp.]